MPIAYLHLGLHGSALEHELGYPCSRSECEIERLTENVTRPVYTELFWTMVIMTTMMMMTTTTTTTTMVAIVITTVYHDYQ